MDGDRGVRVRKALIGFVALLLIAQFARTMAAELIPGDPVPIESAAPAPDPTVAPTVIPDIPVMPVIPVIPVIPTDSPAPATTDAPVPTQAPAPAPTEIAPAPAQFRVIQLRLLSVRQQVRANFRLMQLQTRL